MEVEARFSALFNDALVAAFSAFGTSDQAFAINFDQLPDQPQNYYREEHTIDDLLEYSEPDLPALAIWTGEGQNEQFEKPRLFSGSLRMYGTLFAFVKGIRKAGLGDQREAVESALIAMLDPEFPGLGYRGDLSWGKPIVRQFVAQDGAHVGWAQETNFTWSFEVNV
jgi:hypothetical protein